MTVFTYNLLRDSGKQLSKNFIVNEFACNDGNFLVKIDSKLIDYLQQIRSHFNKPLIITSGYRTKTYNCKIGSNDSSYHVKGMAADFYVKDISPLVVSKYAEKLGVLGIGYYPTEKFVHIDTRTYKFFWRSSKVIPVNHFI